MRSVRNEASVPLSCAIHVRGFKINPLTKGEFIDLVGSCIKERRQTVFTYLNLHGLAMMYKSTIMTKLMRCYDSVVLIDGMSLIVLLRIIGYKLNFSNRVTSLDYIDDLFSRAQQLGWKVYYVGGSEDTNEKGLKYFQNRFPRLSLFGHHGYFDILAEQTNNDHSELIDDINSCGTDLLIIGMGMPRQEEWAAFARDKINAPAVLTIGAMLEYFTGSLKKPPRWLGPIGLEWLFRLITSPRRLAFRYIVEPFILIAKLVVGRPH